MKNRITLFLILILFSSCFKSQEEKDAEKIKIAEAECAKQKSIQGISIAFFGYFPSDADSISIKIKRGNKIVKNSPTIYLIPFVIP